ncbi:lytic polysaccharide monooxygenase auxiliary activity family 9 protein [Streptomyces sp. NPDC004126]|uniref:lytic polysaccharide monooxygenase auxiliary activity family 9 protein n=1 Tax=Streptomyces sp. NPDC004126 TaxID=3390695 RepID=UPI003D074D5D
MSARRSRTAARIAAAGLAPLAVAAYAAGPAAAHGSMTDPVSRVAACYAEGPEAPKSAACKAAVTAAGPQAFYDWNGVNIANAAGQHKSLIPDGQLCSAGNAKYKGLDLARADWPASPMTAGAHTFRYKGTAPHKGSFELYVTKDGYDPSKPLKWSDLEPAPFAKATDPGMQNGDYVFGGTVPKKTGRHLIFSIWQRSDSPEAFYTCSDVVFGKDGGGSGTAPGTGTAPSAKPSAGSSAKPVEPPKAPTDQQISDGSGKSTIEHNGHGDNDPKTNGRAAASPIAAAPGSGEASAASSPAANANGTGTGTGTGTGGDLAATGGSSATPLIAVAGAGALAAGAAVMFAMARRRATAGRHGR